MLRFQGGDVESFSELLRRNRDIVFRYLTRMVRNEAVAEELAQDVFLRIFRARAKYEATAQFSTWLYRIGTNVAMNHFRDEKRALENLSLESQDGLTVGRVVADRGLLVEERLIREVEARQVRRAIRALPARQRAAVIMHKYEELDYREIAQVLGCTTLAVKALLFRTYEKLRFRLASTDAHGRKRSGLFTSASALPAAVDSGPHSGTGAGPLRAK